MKDRYILVVDHATSFRETLSHFIGKSYTVLQAENGRVAIELLAKNSIDLIITGLDMTVMGGLELVRSIKSDDATKNIPVVVVANFDQPEIEVHALELGATDVLAKPFPPEVALQRIKNILAMSKTETVIAAASTPLLELNQVNMLLQAITDEAPTGVVVYSFSLTGNSSKILLFNDRLAALLGYSKSEMSDILNNNLTAKLHPEDAPTITAKIRFSMQNALNFSVVCRALHKNGSYILLSIAATAIQNDGKNIIFFLSCTASEIANLRDSLTGLYSREATVQLADEVFVRDSSAVCTLFTLNVDNFNSLNENFGRDFGDKVLMEVADKLRKIFRSQDIISRTGGDEFCVFLSNEISKELIDLRAQQIISSVFRQYSNWRCNVEISASVGISISPINGANFESLYTTAKTALLKVKKTGKNNYSLA